MGLINSSAAHPADLFLFLLFPAMGDLIFLRASALISGGDPNARSYFY
jgi:hypothetical protein